MQGPDAGLDPGTPGSRPGLEAGAPREALLTHTGHPLAGTRAPLY